MHSIGLLGIYVKKLAPFAIFVCAVGAGAAALYWLRTSGFGESPNTDAPFRLTNDSISPVRTPRPRDQETPVSAYLKVYGTAIDSSTGLPVVGASVRARAENPRQRGDDAGPRSEEVITDENGAFELNLNPGEYDGVTCVAKGYTRQREAFTGGGAGAGIRIDFHMVPGAAVAGTVSDKESAVPVEGAVIELLSASENFIERAARRGGMGGLRGRTDEKGYYVVDGVPAGTYRVVVSTRDTGYLFSPEDAISLEAEAGQTYENIDFALRRGAAVAGRVTRQDGTPVARAEIYAMPAQMIQRALRQIGFGGFEGIGPLETRSDDDGEYELRGLEHEAEYRVIARADGFAVAASDPFEVTRAALPHRVDLVLTVGSKVSGSARRPDGTPVADVRVLLLPESANAWSMFLGPRTATTGADGRFALEHVAAGPYWLRPEGDFARRNAMVRDDAVAVQVDGLTDVTNVELIVEPGVPRTAEEGQGVIRGTVVAQTGERVAEVRVEAKQTGNPRRTYGTTTEADGSFELTGLVGPLYDLEVNSDLGTAKQPLVAVGSSVKLQLTTPAAIRGVVVDATGQPVASCRVSLRDLDHTNNVSSLVNVVQSMMGMASGGKTTDAYGEFEFTRLSPGSYRVKAESSSQGSAESDVIVLAAGEEDYGIHLVLDPGVAVSGVVVGPSGEGIRGATVQLAPQGEDATLDFVSHFLPTGMLKTGGVTTSGSSGEFQISKVAPGVYRLVATHSAYAKAIVDGFVVDAGRDITGYRLVMGKGGEARGTFTMDGKPQPNSMIAMVGPSGVELVQTDHQGRFEVTGLTAGPHMVVAIDPSAMASNGNGLQFNPRVVDIAEGVAADINLGGSGGMSVNGTVTGENLGSFTVVALRTPGGPPLDSIDLMNFNNLIESFRSLGGQTVVGPDGTFSLENVEPGTYTLEVYSIHFDESNPDLNALLNMPRSPVYRDRIEIGADTGPLTIAIP